MVLDIGLFRGVTLITLPKMLLTLFSGPNVYCKGLPGESSSQAWLASYFTFCGGGSGGGTHESRGIRGKCSTTQLHTQPQSNALFPFCYFPRGNHMSLDHGDKKPECNFQISHDTGLWGII